MASSKDCEILLQKIDSQTAQDYEAITTKPLCDASNNKLVQTLLNTKTNDFMQNAKLMYDFVDTLPSVFLLPQLKKNLDAIKNVITQKMKENKGLSPTQMLVIRSMLPPQAFDGYDKIPDTGLKLPEDHKMHLTATSDWWFFVGQMYLSDGTLVAPEVQFNVTNIFPSTFLQKHKLSPTDYAYPELHLSLSIVKDGKQYYLKNNSTLINGGSGLVYFNVNEKDSFLPLQLGSSNYIKLYADGNIEMNVTDKDQFHNTMSCKLLLHPNKAPFMQGTDNGCAPCISGLGSLYYSYTNLSLVKGDVTFSIDNKVTTSTTNKGKFWIDHQWAYGTPPTRGYVDSWILRAISNVMKATEKEGAITGWNWYEMQLDDNTEITGAYMFHQLFLQDPGTFKITVPDGFQMITKDSKRKIIAQTIITLTDFMEYQQTNMKSMYYPTTALLRFSDPSIPDIRLKVDVNFPVHYFRNGFIYREGPATLYNELKNTKIGQGFFEIVMNAPAENTRQVQATLLQIPEKVVAEITDEKVSKWVQVQSYLFLLLAILMLLLGVQMIYKGGKWLLKMITK
jgi:hypothetical protein